MKDERDYARVVTSADMTIRGLYSFPIGAPLQDYNKCK